MPFFDSENTGKWCYFDVKNKKLGGACLRPPTPEVTARITKETTHTKQKFKRNQYYDVTTTDDELANKKFWDYCITDWKEVYLPSNPKVVAACTAENKVQAVKNWEFLNFCNTHIDAMMEENPALEEARLKNSPSSSGDK